jgi:hypothetical protein
LKHSEGFNPHPLLSIVLPLPLGQESVCEFLDVTFGDEVGSFLRLPERLNPCLPQGIRVERASVPMMKPGDAALVRSELAAEDFNWPEITGTLLLEKKTKTGNVRRIEVEPSALERVSDALLVCTLPPDVSPSLVADALSSGLCRVTRTSVYGADGRDFV